MPYPKPLAPLAPSSHTTAPGGTLRRFLAASGLWLALVVAVGSVAQADTTRPDRYPAPARYKERIDLWVVQDKETNPPQGGIVFTGSSTITMWNDNLAKDFEGFTVLGRGFGGSTIADSVEFADKTVIPHAPRQIVFYAGENDIAAGLSPQGVLEDFQAFVEKVRDELPHVPILYLSMKPSPLRWGLQPQFDAANALIKAYCDQTDGLTYVAITAALLGADGQPQEELYLQDRLHLNKEGYAILEGIIRPLLLPEPPAKVDAAPQAGDPTKPAAKKNRKQKSAPKEDSGEMMMQ